MGYRTTMTGPKSFDEWVAVYEERDSDTEYILSPGEKVVYDPMHGFFTYLFDAESKELLVPKMCGNGKHWRPLIHKLVRDTQHLGVRGVLCCTKRNPQVYMRVLGGSDTVTITTNNLPAHVHTVAHTHGAITGSLSSAGDHYHWYRDYSTHEDAYVPSYKEAGMSYIYFNYQMATGSTNMYVPVMVSANRWSTSDGTKNAGTHSHTLSGASVPTYTGNSGSVGAGTALSILPTYYALAFIIKT